jgi:diketogulonate reductase-like aldo/keto reductase
MQYDLAQLGMKYVDLVLIHHPDTDACNQALWKGLQQAQAMGLTKSIGVSNFSPAQMEALMKVGPTPVRLCATASTPPHPSCNIPTLMSCSRLIIHQFVLYHDYAGSEPV